MTTLEPLAPHDWSMIEPHYATLLAENVSPERVTDWLHRWSNLEERVLEARAQRKRRMYLDVTDHAAREAFESYAREIMVPSRAANRALSAKLLAVPHYEPLPAHRQMVRRWSNEIALAHTADPVLHEEITALEHEYARIASTAQESQTPASGGEDAWGREDSPQAREAAWRAEQTGWLQQRTVLNQLFLELLTLRRRVARQAGLSDYRAYRWRELNLLDYGPEDVLTSHDAVAAEIVPLMTRWRTLRSPQVNAASLKPWEAALEAEPHPAVHPFLDAQELIEGVSRLVARVDPEFGALFQSLRAGYLHVRTSPTMAAVNEEFLCPQSQRPCIFVSPRPGFEDIPTLLHESGHAFHDVVSQAQQGLWWNVGGPFEWCEFAANTMIMLADPYLERDNGGFYTGTEAARARSALMTRWCGYYLPRIAALDTFAHWVYGEAPETVRPSDLDEMWLTQAHRFLPDEDWSGLDVERMTGWQQEGSLFTAPLSRSYSSLAILGALQLGIKMLADQPTAVRAVRDALALGGSRPSPELYAMAGARWPFDRRVVRTIAQFVAPLLHPSL